MHRLVQGDVGCGKTIVSLIVACQVIESGLQAVIMAPTEILAEQHYKTAQKFSRPTGNKNRFTDRTYASQEKKGNIGKTGQRLHFFMYWNTGSYSRSCDDLKNWD